MVRYIIDTNGLISFVTDRSLEQQKKIGTYFAQAADGECGIVLAGITVSEFVYVLEKVYKRSSDETAGLLNAFLSTPGFDIVPMFDLKGILALWPKKVPDFGDAAIAAIAAFYSFTVLTFDRPLGKQLERLHIPRVVL
jgi:predicted nucleic acid-binding protein